LIWCEPANCYLRLSDATSAIAAHLLFDGLHVCPRSPPNTSHESVGLAVYVLLKLCLADVRSWTNSAAALGQIQRYIREKRKKKPPFPPFPTHLLHNPKYRHLIREKRKEIASRLPSSFVGIP
jgi:hypothetical protein